MATNLLHMCAVCEEVENISKQQYISLFYKYEHLL